jgi:MFS transporter, ACS family, tartrate transporter
MLVVSSWADLLHVRQLAVGSAAINTLWQIGAFLSPYAWGVTKDATGTFRAALIGASGVVPTLQPMLPLARRREGRK